MVADHVAGSALEALLVVEEDAAVGGGGEQVGGTGGHALTGGARPADVGVHGDVGACSEPEVHGCHPVLEGDASPPPGGTITTGPVRKGVAHPKILMPRSVSAA